MTRIALLGRGRWGANIQRTLAGMPGIEVRVSDPRESLSLPSLDGMDAAIIATPGTTHADAALPFLLRGIPTFIEKPFTTSLADARRLSRIAQKKKTIVMIGHIHLYNPAYRVVKSLVRTIGPIQYIHGEGMSNGPYRDDMSVLWDWAPHDLSMMLDLVGTMPRSVQAWGLLLLRPRTHLHDTVLLRLSFPGNISATVHVSWLSPEKRRKLTIVGTKSSIVLDDRAERKVTLYKDMGPTVQSSARGRTAPTVIPHEPRISYPPYAPDPPLTVELTAFLKAVKTKRQPTTDIRQGLQVVQILDAAERSIARGGRPVKAHFGSGFG